MDHEQELFVKVEGFMVSNNWSFKLEGTPEGWTASITQKPYYKIVGSAKTRLEALEKLGRQIDELML